MLASTYVTLNSQDQNIRKIEENKENGKMSNIDIPKELLKEKLSKAADITTLLGRTGKLIIYLLRICLIDITAEVIQNVNRKEPPNPNEENKIKETVSFFIQRSDDVMYAFNSAKTI